MNYLDSRGLEERIDELIAEFVDATETDPADTMSLEDWQLGLTQDDAEELAALLELREEAEGMGWEHGIQFIPEDDFPEYTEELAKDCGYIPADLPEWLVIDWDETAQNIAVDYTTADFQGVSYYYREA